MRGYRARAGSGSSLNLVTAVCRRGRWFRTLASVGGDESNDRFARSLRSCGMGGRCLWSSPVGDLNAQTSTASRDHVDRRHVCGDERDRGMGRASGMGMGMGGMGLMPMMSAMNPSASLSPTDAAALGMQGPGNNAGNEPDERGFHESDGRPLPSGVPDVGQPDWRDDDDEPDGG